MCILEHCILQNSYLWCYSLVLQGTIAADLGLGAEIEVGTNVEALVVTQPFFYTLNKFELDAFIRVRAFVGLNSAISDVIRDVQDLKQSDKFECESK